MMEDYLQTEWPDLRVWLTSTTDQWAVIAVQGPAAREIIAALVDDIDCAPTALPHMSVVEGRICGVRLLLFRVSFTGELGFELNVPTDYAPLVWDAILAAGTPLGLAVYGTEAMHVLRAEKGYIIIGQETDGTVTPDDVGLGWAIARGKGDFVGKRSLARAGLGTGGRKQLVGVLTEDPKLVLEEGAQITAAAVGPVPRTMLGHVTSAYFSPALNRSIALALVANGRAMLGSTLYVPMPDSAHAVRLTSPAFYDPQAGRMHG
jgi:sarcosine oxidase subunit alpha